MANEDDIALGYRVEDKISGFTGIVTDIGTHITGCTRFGVMPDNDDRDDQRGDTEFFYAAQLEIVAENTSYADDGEDSIMDVDFELGDEVQDAITDFCGVATTITYNLYNCPRVAVQPTYDTDSGSIIPSRSGETVTSDHIEREWFDAPRTEKTGNGISADYEELIEEGETVETGAPASDVGRKTDKQ